MSIHRSNPIFVSPCIVAFSFLLFYLFVFSFQVDGKFLELRCYHVFLSPTVYCRWLIPNKYMFWSNCYGDDLWRASQKLGLVTISWPVCPSIRSMVATWELPLLGLNLVRTPDWLLTLLWPRTPKLKGSTSFNLPRRRDLGMCHHTQHFLFLKPFQTTKAWNDLSWILSAAILPVTNLTLNHVLLSFLVLPS